MSTPHASPRLITYRIASLPTDNEQRATMCVKEEEEEKKLIVSPSATYASMLHESSTRFNAVQCRAVQCSAVRDGSEQPSAASLLRRDGMGFFTQPLLSNSTSSSSCSCSCKVVSSGPPGRRKLIQNLGRRRRRRRRKKADESEQGVGGM